MNLINYISIMAIPLIILLIIYKGVKEKIPVFDVFLKGATEGIEITLKRNRNYFKNISNINRTIYGNRNA